MKVMSYEVFINNFGKGVTRKHIDEMEEVVAENENKILNAFRDQNNIFGNTSKIIHIDAKYIPDKQWYKIEVQKSDGDKKTIGLAFISEAVKIEIDKASCNDVPNMCKELCTRLKQALKSSMEEVKNTQTSRTHVVRTNDEE